MARRLRQHRLVRRWGGEERGHTVVLDGIVAAVCATCSIVTVGLQRRGRSEKRAKAEGKGDWRGGKD